jgi:hypothetical protein
MEGMKDVEVVRFERDRVDNASEQTFNTLDARLKPFPMYELRLFKGSQFKRLFAFVYIDGGFRFVITPDFTDGRMYGKKSSGAQASSGVAAPWQRLRLPPCAGGVTHLPGSTANPSKSILQSMSFFR